MFYKSNAYNTLYNNFQMKNFNLFLLTVGLLFISSYSQISFGVVGPFTASAFRCLASSVPHVTIPYVTIRAYQNSHSPPGIDPNALQTITNAFVAGFYTGIYMEICRGINATSQINLVNSEIMTPMVTLPSAWPNHQVVIKVVPSVNPDCSWEVYAQQDNCNYLTEAVKAVKNLRWTPIIFTTYNLWNKYFGATCADFSQSTGAQLFYAIYDATGKVNSVPSFNGFVPFGGWSIAGMHITKQIGGSVLVPLLCGNKAWHALVDEYFY